MGSGARACAPSGPAVARRDAIESREAQRLPYPAMRRDLAVRRAIFCTWGLALLARVPALAQEADQEVRRILVLFEEHSLLPANIQVAAGFERTLSAAMPAGREIYSEYLDLTRYPGAAHAQRLVGLLTAKYRDIPLDLLVVAGPGSEELAHEAARDMTQNWKVARELAQQRGAAFLGVLQPNAYCGRYGQAQNKEPSIGMYSQFYDAVRAAVPENLEFLDLSDVMPPDDRVFYDIAHTGSKGNRIIAGKIAERLASLLPGD